jgi:hypothetical protein
LSVKLSLCPLLPITVFFTQIDLRGVCKSDLEQEKSSGIRLVAKVNEQIENGAENDVREQRVLMKEIKITLFKK